MQSTFEIFTVTNEYLKFLLYIYTYYKSSDKLTFISDNKNSSIETKEKQKK